MEKKKRRQKSCGEIALTLARQARRQKKHPILVGWIFIATLLSIRTPVTLPATAYRFKPDNDWPISDYERGFSTSPKSHRQRYSEQPSMKRLLRDLRRPAARDVATEAVLTRIDNSALRGWVIEQICEDRINRLAIHAHPGLSDTAVIASWQAELDAQNTAKDAVVNDDLQARQPPDNSMC